MIAVILIWWASLLLHASKEWQLYIVIMASVVGVWGTYVFINYHAERHTNLLHRLVNFNVFTHLGRKEWWQRFTDFLDKPEDKILKKLAARKEAEPVVVEEEPIDPDNLKEQDRKKILDFMKGRAEVMVYDITEHSGANRLRVYPILYEEAMKGRIRIIKTQGLGAPEIVALNH